MANNSRSHRPLRGLQIFLAIVILASASFINAETPYSERVSAEKLSVLKRAVVIITTVDKQDKPLLQGSGFFVRSDCIATNMHVIKDAGQIRITTFAGKTSTIQSVIATNEKDDLALLKVERYESDDILELERATPVEGETILVLSNPQGSPWKVTRGRMGLLWAFGGFSGRLQISATISPGSSGGPVLNEQGRVVGIAAMHIPSEEDLNFAVPVESLKALLQSSTNLSTNVQVSLQGSGLPTHPRNLSSAKRSPTVSY